MNVLRAAQAFANTSVHLPVFYASQLCCASVASTVVQSVAAAACSAFVVCEGLGAT